MRKVVRWAGRLVGWSRRPRSPHVACDRDHTATYVGDGRVLVGAKVGGHRIAYYVEADDWLLTPNFITTGEFERKVTSYFLRNLKVDSHCLDIGTNFGYYTCLMAVRCHRGMTIGVEAERSVADLARANVFINGLQDVADVVWAAASDDREGLTLYRRTFRSGNTSVVNLGEEFTSRLGEPPVQPFRVDSLLVDDLADRLGGRVDFIKIDVEGAEPLVLAGARETIRRNRNISIAMEWSPGQIAAAGFDIAAFAAEITRLGLRCFLLETDRERPLPQSSLAALSYQSAIILRRDDAARG